MRCGAVWLEETLFEDYLRVCGRQEHDDDLHNDGRDTWRAMPGERRLMEYTCNNVHKKAAQIFFCDLTLGHEGDHGSGEVTWPQETFDDERDPRIW